MTNYLQEPYNLGTNLPFDMVGKEAVDLFSDTPEIPEVRFERETDTKLIYHSYFINPETPRPAIKPFELVVIACNLSRLEESLISLTSVANKPSIRVIKPNKHRHEYAVFANFEELNQQ